jgi:hypothetical protein
MAYSLVGEILHEWMGIAMLALFVLHHIWNRTWYKSMGRGRASPYRMVHTALNLLLFAAVLGMILSGLILSRHVLGFLPLQGVETIARVLHLPLAYWGFLLMSLHLGLHWAVVMNTSAGDCMYRARHGFVRCSCDAAAHSGLWLYAFTHSGF